MMELVRGQDEGGVEVVPSGIGTLGDPLDLVVGESDTSTNGGVLTPLVLGLAVPARTQDEDLAVARGQVTAAEQHPAKGRPPFEQLGVMGEGGEDVQLLVASPRRLQPFHDLSGAFIA